MIILYLVGDLYKEENIKDFAKVVKEGTKEGGVDLVTADGVRSVKNDLDIISTEYYDEN